MKPASFDVAFFSFSGHQHLLVPGLRSIIKNVPDYQKLILVWDDSIDWHPIDFTALEDQIEHKLTVVKHSELYPWPESIIKWGWIKQQLAKLLCWKYSSSTYTWICDGDVLVTGDPELFVDNKPCIRYDPAQLAHLNEGYCKFISKYFNITDLYKFTLVGSTCLFDNQIVKEMFDYCQTHHSKSLVECVQETIESPYKSLPFSEFETYGNYCLTHYPENFYLTSSNWNDGPNINNIDRPIQVMWENFNSNLVKAESLCLSRKLD